MADFDYDFEPPSFSLGLHLDVQSEPQPAPLSNALFGPAKQPSKEEDDAFEYPVRVSDTDPPRAFKRLRCGPTDPLTSDAWKKETEDARCNGDDEIDSEEDWTTGNIPTSSVCSRSQSSLHGQKVLTSESGSKWKSGNRKELSCASASANIETNGSSVIFPKLTASPLRRFQLIDSDSDDPFVSEDTNKKVKEQKPDSSKRAAFSDLGTKKASDGEYENEDLWKELYSEKSSRIPTPAFDEICQEYFTSLKNKSESETYQKGPNIGTKCNVGSLPPSHCYFFHKDTRIQKLVHHRLPHFFPLGKEDYQEVKQHNSVIDYMGQFGHEGNSRKTDWKHISGKSSTRNKKNVEKSEVDDMSQDSKNWVSPRSSVGLPKNAGNRKVQAVTKSAGHWYTGSDGRRVYVEKNGQELTGQIAYRHYRKESGIGFKNSKKKIAKKKSGPNKR